MDESLISLVIIIVVIGVVFWGVYSMLEEQERECVEECKEFSLGFYKYISGYGSGCWCLENEIPKQIY